MSLDERDRQAYTQTVHQELFLRRPLEERVVLPHTWARPLTEEEIRDDWASGGSLAERAAIGFLDATFGEPYWYELRNTAPAAEAHRRFELDPDEVRAALLSGIVASVNSSVKALCVWHTHTAQRGPSELDVSAFPAQWGRALGIPIVGCVFYVPTAERTVYNETGVISPVSGYMGFASNESAS